MKAQKIRRSCASKGMDPHKRKVYARHRDVRKSADAHSTPFISAKNYTEVPSKVTVNQPGDKYEQEADRMADHVTRKTSTSTAPPMISRKDGENYQVNRMCASCEQEVQRSPDEDHHQKEQLATSGTPIPSEVIVQRKCDENISKKSAGLGVQIAPLYVAERLHARTGQGAPINKNVRGEMEQSFGMDFKGIRIHNDPEAAFLSKELNAHAFTFGADIYFGQGKFDVSSIDGKHLLAHELTHTFQNGETPLQKELAAENKGGNKQQKKGLAPKSTTNPSTFSAESTGSQTIAPAALPSPFKMARPADAAAPSPAPEQASKQDTEGKAASKTTGTALTDTTKDKDYQEVIQELGKKSKKQKKPYENKNAEKKKEELPPQSSIKNESARTANAGMIQNAMLEGGKAVFTEEHFIQQFKEKAESISAELPSNKKEDNNFSWWVSIAKQAQVQVIKAKEDIQKEAAPVKLDQASETANALKEDLPKNTDIKPDITKPDPAGRYPKISQPGRANPKPKTDGEISLEEKSRALDDYFLEQEYEVKEENLFFHISREKDFDDAAKSKQEAQEKTRQVPEEYRLFEGAALQESQAQINESLTKGLGKMYGKRKTRFTDIKDCQQKGEVQAETRKEAIFREFQEIYFLTKVNVDKALLPLNDIDIKFEAIVETEMDEFNKSVKQDLQYICPCCDDLIFCDYSDWKKVDAKQDIERERERLIKSGVDPMWAHSQAYETVQQCHYEIMFQNKKDSFIRRVEAGVRSIAKIVVDALNEAKACIKAGEVKAQQKLDCLPKADIDAGEMAFTAIKGQFENLTSLVNEQHDEIVSSMARTYTNNVNKLRDEYERLKRENETTWLEAAWDKVKAVIKAIIDFARRIVRLLGRLVHLVGDIIASPGAFFDNLIEGIKQGFSTFVGGIDTFLSKAFFNWLRGASGIPIEIPKTWDAKGIFRLFTQLLNLSTETIWERMEEKFDKKVANAFRTGERIVERGLEVFSIIRKDGLAGLWEYIKDSMGNILEETLEMIKETVLYAAVKKVIIEIGKLLVPGGGFIVIAEKVIRLLQFIFDARDKILNLIEAFLDGVEMAVKGNIPGIVLRITSALTQFITVAIDFLVTFFGLRSLKDKVQQFIERMRKPVIKGIDWMLDKLAPLIRKIFRMKKEEPAGVAEEEKDAHKDLKDKEVGKTVYFSADGDQHRLWIDTAGAGVRVMVRSTPMTVDKKLNEWEAHIDSLEAEKRDEARRLIGKARGQYQETKRSGDKAEREMNDVDAKGSEKEIQEARKADDKVEIKEETLAKTMRQLFKLFGEGDDVPEWWKNEVVFYRHEEKHSLLFKGEGQSAILHVQSVLKPLQEYIKKIDELLKTHPDYNKVYEPAIIKIRTNQRNIFEIRNNKSELGKTAGAEVSSIQKKIAKELSKLPELEDVEGNIELKEKALSVRPPSEIDYNGKHRSSFESARIPGKVVKSLDAEKVRAKLSINPGNHSGNSSVHESEMLKELKLRPNEYKGGHLLNHNLYGDGSKAGNITPITTKANKDMEKGFEKEIKRLVLTENKVISVVINPNYLTPKTAPFIPAEGYIAARVEFILKELTFNDDEFKRANTPEETQEIIEKKEMMKNWKELKEHQISPVENNNSHIINNSIGDISTGLIKTTEQRLKNAGLSERLSQKIMRILRSNKDILTFEELIETLFNKNLINDEDKTELSIAIDNGKLILPSFL